MGIRAGLRASCYHSVHRPRPGGREVREHATRPLHPYTQALLDNALPAHPDDARESVLLTGEVPSAFNPPPGCRFHTCCPHAMPVCAEVEPALREEAPGQIVACHLYEPGGARPLISPSPIV